MTKQEIIKIISKLETLTTLDNEEGDISTLDAFQLDEMQTYLEEMEKTGNN